jgi:hypothetical protein
MAVRIAKIMNGERAPQMSIELIYRLLKRFKLVAGVFSKNKDSRKKIHNFEFLTSKFLSMEGRDDLASMFKLHKTRIVLYNADKRLEKCCDLIESREITNWQVKRSC